MQTTEQKNIVYACYAKTITSSNKTLNDNDDEFQVILLDGFQIQDCDA